MFFLATADADGQPQCSYKGGDPGFVRVVDATTIAFPVYDGNGMFLSVGNLTENAQVGLLFIDFSNGSRLRLNGEASVDPADPLVGEFPGAKLVVRVRVRAVFPNCRRYVHTHGPTQRSVFVPVAGERTAGARLEAGRVVRRHPRGGRPGTRRDQPQRPVRPAVLTGQLPTTTSTSKPSELST